MQNQESNLGHRVIVSLMSSFLILAVFFTTYQYLDGQELNRQSGQVLGVSTVSRVQAVLSEDEESVMEEYEKVDRLSNDENSSDVPKNSDKKLQMRSAVQESSEEKLILEVWQGYHDPFSHVFEKTIQRLLDEYPDKIELVIKQFPIESIHPGSTEVAIAALCVEKQNPALFKQLHRWLHSKENNKNYSYDEVESYIAREFDEKDGFNYEDFITCVNSTEIKSMFNQTYRAGLDKGINGSPTSYLRRLSDGEEEKIGGAVQYEQLAAQVKKLLNKSNSTEDDSDDSSSERSPEEQERIKALRARIKQLNRQPSQEERAVLAREKNAARKANQELAKRLKGKILLQVEENGEAWYLDELTNERFYLADGDSAYEALRAFGLGVSNSDLAQIPIGVEERAEKNDSDGDGLDDQLEEALGTDPNNSDSDDDGYSDGEEARLDYNELGQGQKKLNRVLAQRLEGKILLQVEGKGEAWYIHNGRRFYMKNGRLAYQIMKFLSLGITNEDLRQIEVGDLE